MAHAEPEPIGAERLAEGMTIVRASTLKMIRLQLAMERYDRRVALKAIDDLLALDGRLKDYLAMAPALDGQVAFRHELDAERAMLNSEKLALAAEVLRRPDNRVIEQRQPPDDDWLGPRDLVTAEEVNAEEPRRRRRWLVAIPVLASAVAASVYFAGVSQLEAWLAVAGLR